MMQCSWLGERVATANVAKVVENVLRYVRTSIGSTYAQKTHRGSKQLYFFFLNDIMDRYLS